VFKYYVHLFRKVQIRMEKDTKTGCKILDAARRVFVAKGFNGCSSREIANEAGMNVALVNYHFKSKENLFDIVVSSVLQEFSLSIFEVFKSEMSLINKTRTLIEKEYEFLSKHPDVPAFIIGELSKKDKTFFDCLQFTDAFQEANILAQIKAAQDSGEMIKIDFVNIMLLVMSNCHFPFMAKPMIQTIHPIDDNHYQDYLKIHKQYVTEMVINYLFPSKK